MRISDWSSDVCSSDLTNLDDFNTREQCYANASAGGLGRAILKSKEDRPTWTIGLDYQAADNVFLYAVTRRGFREGGINGPLFNSPAALAFGLDRFQTYDAEIVTDIEIGAKTDWRVRSEEQTSALQSLIRISYAVFCLNKTKKTT